MALSVKAFGTIVDLDALERRMKNIAVEPIFMDTIRTSPFNSVEKISPKKGFRYYMNIDKKEEQYYTEAFELLHFTKGIDFFYTDNATSIDGLVELKDMLELHIKKDMNPTKIFKVWDVKRALENIQEEEEQHVK